MGLLKILQSQYKTGKTTMVQKLQINLEENLRKEIKKKKLNNKEIERTKKKKKQKPAIRWNFKA